MPENNSIPSPELSHEEKKEQNREMALQGLRNVNKREERLYNFVTKKIKDSEEAEAKKRLEVIQKYSEIVDQMPEETASYLTSSMGNITVTAKESFVNYFKDRIPLDTYENFSIKFVEKFVQNKEKYHQELKKNLDSGKKEAIPSFWKNFDFLFNKKKRICINPVLRLLMKCISIPKLLFKCFFTFLPW